jgi:hypothetical protein
MSSTSKIMVFRNMAEDKVVMWVDEVHRDHVNTFLRTMDRLKLHGKFVMFKATRWEAYKIEHSQF